MTSPDEQPPPRLRRRKRRLLIVGSVFLIVAWLGHPTILALVLREVIDRGIAMAGWQVTIGGLEASLDRPWVLRDVHIWARDPQKSGTDVFAKRLDIAFNRPWQKFDGLHRFINSATVDGIHGVFDLRPEALPPPYMPDLSVEEQKKMAEMIMQFLPISAHVRDADLEFLAPGQSYRLVDGVADFEEGKAGLLTIQEGYVRAGTFKLDTGPLTTVTGWADGTASLTDLVFRDDMKVTRFRARFANVGGVALDLNSEIFGGRLSGDIVFTSQNDLPAMDTWMELEDFDLGALSALLTLEPPLQGTVAKARYTFRGIPEKIWDAESSLGLRLVNPRRLELTSDAVEVEAHQKLRQVTVSRVFAQLGDNTVQAEGEASLDEKGEFNVQASPFTVKVTGALADISELSPLLGPSASKVTGRLDFSGTASRTDGKIVGTLKADGQALASAEQPIESLHLEVACAENVATITKLEVKAREDSVQGSGQVALAAPYAYSGELSARIVEVAPYLALLGNPATSSIFSGMLDARWKGHGTTQEHTGEFQLSVKDFFSEQTPSGLNGEVAGSYTPQDVSINSLSLNHQSLKFATRIQMTRDGVTIPDASLLSGETSLGAASIFLPLNVFAMANGKPLKDAWIDGDVKVALSTKGPLKVSDLMQLAGQSAPLKGTVAVDLQASGKLTELTLNGDLKGRDLIVGLDNGETPPASFDATLKSTSGIAQLSGSLSTRGMPPLTISAEMPFGFSWNAQNEIVFANPEGRLTAQLSVPQTDLGVFQSFLPAMRQLKGTLTGGVAVTGTMSQPQFNGRLALSNGTLQFSPRAPVIGNLQGALKFTAERADIEKFSGELAAGPFNVRGGISFANPSNLQYDFSLSGQKLLLVRDPGLRLRANVELQARGDNNGGSLKGEVAFVDGRIYRRLEITPMLAPSPVSGPLFTPPDMAGLVPPPFSRWNVDVHIVNASPFKLVGNIASGEIVPDLRITNTLGHPIPVGRVELKEARAFLPFTTLRIQEGHMDFVESSPWVPQLDVRGTAQTQDYTIQAYAYGPLNDHRLILRADPPLPQESIVLLLTTGFAPGIYAGAGFGEAAVGQGGLLLLRAILRQFEPEGVDVDSFMNRLQVTATPPQTAGDGAGLRGRFELWRGIAAMSERDSYGYYNAGATYTFRFR